MTTDITRDARRVLFARAHTDASLAGGVRLVPCALRAERINTLATRR